MKNATIVILAIFCATYAICQEISKAQKELDEIFAPLQQPPQSKEDLDKKLSKAEKELKDFLKKYAKDPKTSEAYQALSEIYHFTKRTDLAVTTLEECLKNFPNAFQARFMLLKIHVDSGKEEKAKETAKLLLEGDHLKEIEDLKGFKATVARMLNSLKMQVGKVFPEFSYKALDGKMVNLKDYKGKVTLIDFWATWCIPCVYEMPNVIAVYKKYKSQGFEILGVSLDKDQKELEQFLEQHKIKWRQYFDGQGWNNKFATQCGVQGIPKMILIDGEGNIRYINPRGKELESAVASLLKEKEEKEKKES